MLTISRDGLIGERYLNGSAADTSGNGYNGTANNITWLLTNIGYQSKTASFNGSSSYVFVGSGLSAFKTQQLTISGWFKTTSGGYIVDNNLKTSGSGSTANSGCGIFIDTADGRLKGNYLLLNNETYTINYSNGTTETITNYVVSVKSINSVNDGEWHYFVFIVNGNSAKLYLDGVLQSTVTTTQSINYGTVDDNYSIGILKYDTVTYYPFNGEIQLIRHYNMVLSEYEIALLYLEGRRKLNTSTIALPELFDGTIAYYDFRKGDLSNLIDGVLATNNGATLTADHLGYPNNAYEGISGGLTLGTSYIAGKGLKTITIIYNSNIAYGSAPGKPILSFGQTGSNNYPWFTLGNDAGYSGGSGIVAGRGSSAGSKESAIGIPASLLTQNKWHIITVILGPKIYNNISGFKARLDGINITNQLINESYSISYGFPTEQGLETVLQNPAKTAFADGKIALLILHSRELVDGEIKALHQLLMS